MKKIDSIEKELDVLQRQVISLTVEWYPSLLLSLLNPLLLYPTPLYIERGVGIYREGCRRRGEVRWIKRFKVSYTGIT